MVGIDGGGTGTVAVLATLDGHVVGDGRGGPANIRVATPEEIIRALGMAIDAACASRLGAREAIGAIAVGLAGAHTTEDKAHWAGVLAGLLPHARLSVHNDGEVALAGATGGRPGIVVVAGTGSISIGADENGRYARCGGWGFLCGDEGSAYAIARRALMLAAQAEDGRIAPSALGAAFMSALGVPSFDDLLVPIYGPPAITRDGLAALAPVVARCAQQGDASAFAVLEDAAADLATLAVTLLRRLDLCDRAVPVACSGGVWKAGALVSEPFRRRVLAACPRVRIGSPLLTPAAGAALLAIRELHESDDNGGETRETVAANQTREVIRTNLQAWQGGKG